MTIPKPTDKEIQQGFHECACGDNVHLLQAGFECRHIICAKCKFSVVNKGEFFRLNDAVEVMSK